MVSRNLKAMPKQLRNGIHKPKSNGTVHKPKQACNAQITLGNINIITLNTINLVYHDTTRAIEYYSSDTTLFEFEKKN